jgi:hypothetical protein
MNFDAFVEAPAFVTPISGVLRALQRKGEVEARVIKCAMSAHHFIHAVASKYPCLKKVSEDFDSREIRLPFAALA